jgi:hypothetical protein
MKKSNFILLLSVLLLLVTVHSFGLKDILPSFSSKQNKSEDPLMSTKNEDVDCDKKDTNCWQKWFKQKINCDIKDI